ncbi:MAG: glycoside hydrolase family 43 protein [Nocardioides sp.]
MSVPNGPLRRSRRAVGDALRRLGLRHDPASEVPRVAGPLEGVDAPLAEGWFVNPIAEGADPHVVRDGDRYLWCQTVGDAGVAVWHSDRPTSLGHRHVVWTAPPSGPWSQQVWAPELHRLDGRWHIYVAASDGRNETHLTYVLVADGDDPLGSYSLHGPLNTGDGEGGTEDNVWAIDMTVLEHDGTRYALWSGWPERGTQLQQLYVTVMDSPTSLRRGRVQITSPFDHAWERVREGSEEAINEAPQVIVRDGRTFVVFSCGSALLPSYKLGLLELVGADPLDPAAWRKHPEPLFASTEATFGVGHSSLVPSPDGSEWWHVYHTKISRERNFKRVMHVQPMGWSADGAPDLGQPVAAGAPVREPTGTPHHPRSDGAAWAFGTDSDGLGDFDYYGHQQYVALEPDGLHLGRVPTPPVNAFRSGEKAVLRDGDYTDVRARARFRILSGDRAVGVLVRVTAPAVGFEAQRGYFAGWVPGNRRLVLRRTDGRTSTDLGSRVLPHPPGDEGTLVVEAVGTMLRVHLESAPDFPVEVEDHHYPRGSVGLRTVGAHVAFTSLRLDRLHRGTG